MAYESIFFGTLDSADIEAQIIAQYVAITGNTPNPSDPEFAICSTIAYARILGLQAIDRAGKANLVQFAPGVNLDYIAALIGLERKDATASQVVISFTLVNGHAQTIIPAGSPISSVDGQAVYTTDADIACPVGINTVTGTATCTTDGSKTNGYAPGSITVIQNPQPFLVSATNTTTSSGGAESETDEEFRARWAIALQALSVAGPKGAYEFYAKSVSPQILDAKCLGPEDFPDIIPGDVEIRILTNPISGAASLLNAVLTACNPDEVRPMCDTVRVLAANEIIYEVAVNVVPFAGADTLTMEARVRDAILSYTNAQSKKIGSDIEMAAIVSNGMLSDVKRIEIIAITGNTNISVDGRSFAILNPNNANALSINIDIPEEP